MLLSLINSTNVLANFSLLLLTPTPLQALAVEYPNPTKVSPYSKFNPFFTTNLVTLIIN